MRDQIKKQSATEGEKGGPSHREGTLCVYKRNKLVLFEKSNPAGSLETAVTNHGFTTDCECDSDIPLLY